MENVAIQRKGVITKQCTRLLPAVASFSILLSHIVSVVTSGVLPVVRSGQKLVIAGVSILVEQEDVVK